MDEPTSENEAVEQLATVEQHSPEAKEESKADSKEINFREMRRGFDELKSKLGEKDKVIDELKDQLSSFKTKVQTAFNPTEEEYSDEDEPMTVGEYKKREAELTRQRDIEDTPKLFADYYDVIKYAEPMLKENPALIDAIEKARNPRLAAYQLVKSSHAYRLATAKGEDAKEIEKNLAKPKTSESLGGASSADLTPRKMSLSEKAEVWKMAQRYARGG